MTRNLSQLYWVALADGATGGYSLVLPPGDVRRQAALRSDDLWVRSVVHFRYLQGTAQGQKQGSGAEHQGQK